ncbi:SRPBCC family protein [Dongia deserti]|uniref:SRPBCC family protein n=1 Tax=Dongia deserti TaxID=2268030 RepID=UPI000E64CBD4|nr:SRPBCC family protein [Dongia deserti]
MAEFATPDPYGVLTEADTLEIRRLLPGPIERVWTYLTESELRRQWLAAGHMELKVGAPVAFVWRNDELTDPPGQRPAGFGDEHRMQSRITELDPPRKLAIVWEGSGDVSFELEPKGDKVLLTVIHRRLPNRVSLLNHGAGWHMHLDLLVARVSGVEPAPFWDGFSRLLQEYDRRLPADGRA